MSETTRLSTKGQVVLPKSLRASRRWRPGTEFIVQECEEGILLKPKSGARGGGWDALIGCVSYRGSRKTIEEMDQAIEAAFKARE
ncbi:MAG: AbrB/MazE/SpoVT family DNA-binding domain-containing protein [Candidatus Binataceae bacterium]